MNRMAARALAASMLEGGCATPDTCASSPVGRGAPAMGRGRGGGSSAGRGRGGGGLRPRPSDSPNSPALITSYIKKASTLEALFQTLSEYDSHLNHIHVAAFWNSLKHLARTSDPSALSQKHGKALEALVELTTRTVSTASDIRARELASIAHGVAKCGRASTMGSLLKALAQAIEKRLGDCNAQELANIAWAFAKAGHVDAELFAALARVAERHLANFKPQELANTGMICRRSIPSIVRDAIC